MCELLAMSSRIPTTVGFTLERLARRGGLEGPHRDGWGVAFYDGPDVFVLREPKAAAHSDLGHFIEHSTPPSELVISHIRLATHGKAALKNTQPFQKALGGRVHIFAHNGELTGLEQEIKYLPVCFKPVGETDSELAFCELLYRLSAVWEEAGSSMPTIGARMEKIVTFAAELRTMGLANFMYSDGDVLFVHGHRRKQANGEVAPPGLHVLEHTCDKLNAGLSRSGVTMTDICDDMTLVASVPLSDANWRPLHEGEVLAISRGEVLSSLQPQGVCR